MPDIFIPLSEVQWVEQLVCDRYLIKVPKFLTAQYNGQWGSWEKARFASMEQHLKKGDILFDVGAEQGWISAIYAQFVGPENCCLFEPCPEVWSNIRATWLQNELLYPKSTCCALVSDTNVDMGSLRIELDGPTLGHWPSAAYTGVLLQNTKYNHIDEDAHRRPQITIDDFVSLTNISPNAITVDVEGAELIVLRGATRTLKSYRPLVWVSLHEGLMRPGVFPKNKDVHDFMDGEDYEGTFLDYDHEAHWLYVPRA